MAKTAAERAATRLKARIRRMVHDHPSEVMDALLEAEFWPQGVRTKEGYRRYGDDNNSFLSVVFSEDGDAWPYVYSEADPKEPLSSPRYRTYFGGGGSLMTRTAVCILARAIARDNENNPQRRAPQ